VPSADPPRPWTKIIVRGGDDSADRDGSEIMCNPSWFGRDGEFSTLEG
jgi:hypothetical protein